MKKAWLGLSISIILGLAACQSGNEELPPLPTLAVVEEVPEMTDAPVPTPTPDATVTPSVPEKTEATNAPTPTATPKPTVTPKPTATPKPTGKPMAPEISALLEQAEVHKNTTIRGTVCTSEEEANREVREMALTYRSFALIVEDAGDLHSAKEYMALYPEIEKMTIEKIDIYRNGICVVFQNVEVVYDANLCYAIRTGETSVLNDTEKKILRYLNDVLDETGARTLTGVEAVKVLHDYLVLELKYDESFQTLSHTPEGVMENKTAVCDGYARTMRLLLMMTGFECKIISGTAGGESHAWNLVRMEDGWYHLDVTWDDPIPDVEGKVGYLYFLKNDADMAQTHTWKSEIVCTENHYQEYVYADVICTSYEEMQDVYEKQIQTEEYLVFCYPKGGTLTEDSILEFVKMQVLQSITYYPEKELADYKVLEIVNPLLEN